MDMVVIMDTHLLTKAKYGFRVVITALYANTSNLASVRVYKRSKAFITEFFTNILAQKGTVATFA